MIALRVNFLNLPVSPSPLRFLSASAPPSGSEPNASTNGSKYARVSGVRSGLKYSFEIAPYSDPLAIHLRYDGADRMALRLADLVWAGLRALPPESH